AMRSRGAGIKACTCRSTTASLSTNGVPRSVIRVRMGTWGLNTCLATPAPAWALAAPASSGRAQARRARLSPQLHSAYILLARHGLRIPQSPVIVQSALARAVVKIPDGKLGRTPHRHGVMKGIRPGDGIRSGIGRERQEGAPLTDIFEFFRQ